MTWCNGSTDCVGATTALLRVLLMAATVTMVRMLPAYVVSLVELLANTSTLQTVLYRVPFKREPEGAVLSTAVPRPCVCTGKGRRVAVATRARPNYGIVGHTGGPQTAQWCRKKVSSTCATPRGTLFIETDILSLHLVDAVDTHW